MIQRNFDPFTGESSPYVNESRYTYLVQFFAAAPVSNSIFCDTFIYAVDPLATSTQPVASLNNLEYGAYLTGLTADDVGGLRYLLSGNLVQFENLLPDVHAQGANDGNLVRTAYRPGIEKITFLRHPFSPLTGQFGPCTNQWTDIYYDWDGVHYQDVERILTRPDVTFSARDLGTESSLEITGTTNWENNADLNDNPGGAGPGVIRPPMTMIYSTGTPL